MLYEIDANGYFICDAPSSIEVSPTIVDQPPLNPDGSGMRKARWTGIWDAANIVWTNGGWVDDEAAQLIATLKTGKWEEIKTYRDKIASGGVYISNISKWFHSDSKSRIQQLRLIQLADSIIASGGALSDNIIINGASQPWKTMDGTFITLTAQIVYDIATAVQDLDSLSFANAETHKANLNASSDPANYDYTTGWPTTYLY